MHNGDAVGRNANKVRIVGVSLDQAGRDCIIQDLVELPKRQAGIAGNVVGPALSIRGALDEFVKRLEEPAQMS